LFFTHRRSLFSKRTHNIIIIRISAAHIDILATARARVSFCQCSPAEVFEKHQRGEQRS